MRRSNNLPEFELWPNTSPAYYQYSVQLIPKFTNFSDYQYPYQFNMGMITEDQIKCLLNKANQLGYIEYVDPSRIIKVGKNVADLRLVQFPSQKYLWDTEAFIDPILKKFILIDNDPNKLFCYFDWNTYRALNATHYPDSHNKETFPQILIPEMAWATNPDYIDRRYEVGSLSYPPKDFGYDFFEVEHERLKKKNLALIERIKYPFNYFKNPKEYDYKTLSKITRQDPKYYRELYRNGYLINLGKYGFRGVESRIEQFVWEECLKKYYHNPYKRCLLNNLILDDDGTCCKIFVPHTMNEFGIIAHLNFANNIQAINGKVCIRDNVNDAFQIDNYLTDYYRNYLHILELPIQPHINIEQEQQALNELKESIGLF